MERKAILYAKTLEHIKKNFLPGLLADLADITTGKRPDWAMPPDDIFIKSLESHLDWPVTLTHNWLHEKAAKNRPFDSRLQEWLAQQEWTFTRNAPDEWAKALDRAARSLVYVWANGVK